MELAVRRVRFGWHLHLPSTALWCGTSAGPPSHARWSTRTRGGSKAHTTQANTHATTRSSNITHCGHGVVFFPLLTVSRIHEFTNSHVRSRSTHAGSSVALRTENHQTLNSHVSVQVTQITHTHLLLWALWAWGLGICFLPCLTICVLRGPSLGPSLSTKPDILGLRFVLRSDQRHRFISISRNPPLRDGATPSFFLCLRANDSCPLLLLRQRTRSPQSVQSVFADVSPPSSGSDVLDGFLFVQSFSSRERVVARVSFPTQCFWFTRVFCETERDRTAALTVVQRRLVFWPLRMDIQAMPHTAPI